MNRQRQMRMALFLALVALAAHPIAVNTQVASPAAVAAKASPELVTALSKEMGSTPEQSAGAAGALLGLAKTRLAPDQFSRIAQAVPGTDSLLSAAPPAGTTGAGGGIGALPNIPGGSGLSSMTSAFNSLGLKPDMVAKAVPVLTSFVTKQGGADVGSLLAGALK